MIESEQETNGGMGMNELEPTIETIEDALRLFEDKGGRWAGAILKTHLVPPKIVVYHDMGDPQGIEPTYYQPTPEISKTLISTGMLTGKPVLGGHDNSELILADAGKYYLKNIRRDAKEAALKVLNSRQLELEEHYCDGEVVSRLAGDPTFSDYRGTLFHLSGTGDVIVFSDGTLGRYDRHSRTHTPFDNTAE
jgi:hypothetical protein